MGDEESIHLIKYMGSKRNLLGFVAPAVREVTPRGGLLLDLFAGTHSVGYAVKQHSAVWGNDIQQYSEAVGRALLLADPLEVRAANLRTLIGPVASCYFREAALLFDEWLSRERRSLALAAYDLDAGWREYCDYVSELHASMPHQGDARRLGGPLRDVVLRVSRGEATDPPIMAAVYWGGTYFSLEQALWLDAYRAAIDVCLPEGHPARAVALACLLHAATYCSISSGHFAQFHKVASRKKLAEQLPYRWRSVESYWRAKLSVVEAALLPSPWPNRVTTLDYPEVLADLRGVDAIYADPPYSFVHYSRFYHVLETLAKYDFPGTEFDGRYRPVPLRHQSPFCIRSQMRSAFSDVLRGAKEAGIPVVWPYSKSGLMPFDKLIALCQKYYRQARVLESEYLHTTMGRAENKTVEVSEVLIICS